MNKLLKYIPFHLFCFLVVGIFLQYYFNLVDQNFQSFSISFIVFLSFFIAFLYLKKRKYVLILTWVLFVFIGSFTTYFNTPIHQQNNYQNFIIKDNLTVIKITKVLKPDLFNDKYYAKVIQINEEETSGEILLNVDKDSLLKRLAVDSEILIKPDFKTIKKPLNPHQFNYKKYLERQGVYQQIFTKNSDLKLLKNSEKTFFGFAYTIREKIKKSLRKYEFSDDEFGVINALLLGQRKEVSKQLTDSYVKAGVIHILAISGLHIGIILLILNSLFKPLERLKYGKHIRIISIVIILWFFALLAGLSVSVVRAVTMFSFVAFGQFLKSNKVTEFSLITSAFVLLLIKPMFLFEVGFQLSYLAVFGIIWMQPKIYELIKSKFKFVDYFMQLISVSLAAQIAVLPLSLYYFHQFPTLFLFSNIVIIPFLGIILFGGIVIIILSVLDVLPVFLADLYGNTISLLNQFVSFIAQQEDFLFSNISMSFNLMLFLYAFIIALFWFLCFKNTKNLIFLLSTVVAIQFLFSCEKYQINTKQNFIIFHKSKYSCLGFREGNELMLFSDMDEAPSFINNYKVSENISTIIKKKRTDYLEFKHHAILIIDSLGVYKIPDLKSSIVILTDSPKINLERLIKEVHPKKIIADGSNYKSYVNNWKLICDKYKVDFKSTAKNGAVIIN